MNKVFTDTLYWVANIAPGDPWKGPALRARAALGEVHLVTTEEVLIEFLTAFAARGVFLRAAANAVQSILSDRNVTVMHQTHFTFLAGLSLYENRADKDYSLTDCISMAAMRAEGITEVLTNDHHFAQEGFTILIRADRH